jgi:hypothetical protein
MLRAKFARPSQERAARLPPHTGIANHSSDMRNDNLSGVIRLIRFYSRGGESC